MQLLTLFHEPLKFSRTSVYQEELIGNIGISDVIRTNYELNFSALFHFLPKIVPTPLPLIQMLYNHYYKVVSWEVFNFGIILISGSIYFQNIIPGP